MKIVGQTKLLNKINNTTIDTFPHTLLLVGELGSGKHLLCNMIHDHLSLPLVDITDDISFETITDIYLSVEPTLYLIDGTKITDRKENALLKLIEEPPKNSFIMIICEATQQLLPTIINRCQVWYLEKYSVEQLREFTNDERILNIARTPGQVIKLTNQNVEGIISLCSTIIDKIGNANYANTLTITDKVALNNEAEKFDVDCFIRFMLFILTQRLVHETDNVKSTKLRQAYFATNELYNDRYIPHINMRNLFDNYITHIKYILS